ncbi:MAG: right-handed parallel beta-helix repeat-containing protein [Marinobacter sp.]
MLIISDSDAITRISSLIFSTLLAFALFLVSVTAAGADYYVDSDFGNDYYSGSENSPWQTLDAAWNNAPSGSTVFVRGGTYSGFEIAAPRNELNDYITFKAEDGEAVRVGSISIVFSDLQAAFVRFEGFDLLKNGSGSVVNLRNAKHFQVTDSDIRAVKWAVDGAGVTGVYVVGSEDILIQGNAMYEIHRGLSISGSKNVRIKNNYIKSKGGTGVQYANGNDLGLIEGNHIRGEEYASYPGNPDAVQSPHASIISIRSSDLTISRNLLHGMGNSSGIMFYDRSNETNYSNILIENNAIFNTVNSYALRIYKLGNNVHIINNLLHSHYRDGDCNGVTKDARYRYNTALQVHSVAPGFDGSGLHVFNNIAVGIVSLPPNARESNNIIWSWYGGKNKGWLNTAPNGSNSHILSPSAAGCGNHRTLFEDGTFFVQPIDFTELDGLIPNFTLASGSIGDNFGDPGMQAPLSLGSVGPDGFLQNDGVTRKPSINDVGPYESFDEVRTSPPSAPVLSIE